MSCSAPILHNVAIPALQLGRLMLELVHALTDLFSPLLKNAFDAPTLQLGRSRGCGCGRS
jgi:hypothetical protein